MSRNSDNKISGTTRDAVQARDVRGGITTNDHSASTTNSTVIHHANAPVSTGSGNQYNTWGVEVEHGDGVGA